MSKQTRTRVHERIAGQRFTSPFTDGAREVLTTAKSCALERGFKSWSPADVLVALSEASRWVPGTFLSDKLPGGVALRTKLPKKATAEAVPETASRAGRGTKLFAKTLQSVHRRTGHDRVATETLLLAVLSKPDRGVDRLLEGKRAELSQQFQGLWLGTKKRKPKRARIRKLVSTRRARR
ncbi:MAG: hypothetical protein J0M12_03890 [Deltaproteobacteria bacterium]|nr:hypothetical protein [Deltaproteobacteria bacterium]